MCIETPAVQLGFLHVYSHTGTTTGDSPTNTASQYPAGMDPLPFLAIAFFGTFFTIGLITAGRWVDRKIAAAKSRRANRAIRVPVEWTTANPVHIDPKSDPFPFRPRQGPRDWEPKK